MGLVLWIDENTFVTALLEKIFKQKEYLFYTLENVNDFSFLINDLRPEMIVLDTVTALKNRQVFKDQFDQNERLKSTPFVLIGDDAEFPFLKKIGQIKRPFDPFTIPEVLLKIKGLN